VKIDGNLRSNPSGVVSEGQTRGTKTTGAGSTPATGAGGPRVQLSALGEKLAGIEASLASVPVFDTQRVEEIKLAISEGRFQVNPDVIADKLLETVQDLIRAQQKG